MARLASVAALLGLVLLATACARPEAGVRVEGAWIATPLGGADTASGFAVIHNGAGAQDRLLSASSPRAGEVTLHEMNMDGMVMTMRPLVGGLSVPAHGEATLDPSGAHLMFVRVAAPMTTGETVPVVLQFEHAGAVSVDFKVADAPPPAHDMHN